MNIDENANVPATYGVRSIPFMALFKNGELVDQQVGVVPKSRLVDMIEKALDRDTFLEADEALKFGIVDKVFETRPANEEVGDKSGSRGGAPE